MCYFFFLYISIYIYIFQGIWFERDSPLWMLPSMNSDLLSQLNKSGIFTVPEMFNQSYENLQRLLRPHQLSDLYKVRTLLH